MNKLDKNELITNTYETTNDPSLVKETIDKVQSALGFKKIIAFSGGGSGVEINGDIELKDNVEKYTTEIKHRIIEIIMMRLKDYDVAVLTGGTTWDIPNIATKLARKYNIPTIGVLPEKAKKNSLGKNLLNAEILIPPVYGDSHYGDESSVFAKLADGMFVIGGGSGTLVEFAHVMKINEKLEDIKEDVKIIIPIDGVPGVSDKLQYIPGKPRVKELTFPSKNITDPKKAFEILRKKLNLDDILKEEY